MTVTPKTNPGKSNAQDAYARGFEQGRRDRERGETILGVWAEFEWTGTDFERYKDGYRQGNALTETYTNSMQWRADV